VVEDELQEEEVIVVEKHSLPLGVELLKIC
jgi:hypothetical protein